MKLTPLKVSMLMALYCNPNFFKTFPSLHSTAQQAALKEFETLGLIIFRGPIPIRTSGKGDDLVGKILDIKINLDDLDNLNADTRQENVGAI